MFFIRKQIGVTLIELTVVLLILIALAGVVTPYISGTSSTALCNATDVTMQNIKKVIMERYYLDTLGYFPKDTKDLTVNDYDLKYLFTKPSAPDWQLFDSETQLGWRGPYLQNGVNNQVLDGWGNPVIIEVPSITECNTILKSTTAKEADCARLISGGFDSTITSQTKNRMDDDRVLYLTIPTPINNGTDNIENTSDDNTVNPSCDNS